MIAESSPFPWFSTARRRTRRIVVAAYWLVALGIIGVYQWAQFFRPGHNPAAGLIFPLQVLVFLPAILGGVRAGGMVKPFSGVHFVPLDGRDYTQTLFGPPRPLIGSMTTSDAILDERERLQRDSVHFAAYTLARWLAFILIVLQCASGLVSPALTSRVGAAAFLLIALVLWSLPQTLILWNEPDVETQQ
ncbi:MAG: hypothetical protein ABR928_09580 [Terracidiphilus sp.]|jgi:hypothetical protein